MTNSKPFIWTIASWLAVPAVLVAGAVAWWSLDPGFRAAGQATEAGATEFEGRVHAYLLANPEVIVEALQRLQERQRAADAGEAQAVLKARADEMFRDPASPVGGNPDGDVTLVEFLDYNCPFCRRVAPVMAEAEAADPRLRVVYKEFPILGPNSVFAARAALAAHRQGRYVALHKALMAAKANVDEGAVLAAAAEVGLDVERLQADMRDPVIQGAIDHNLALARALRITGTPSFVAGGRVLRGATDLATLQGLIREARANREEARSAAKGLGGATGTEEGSVSRTRGEEGGTPDRERTTRGAERGTREPPPPKQLLRLRRPDGQRK